MKLNQEFQNLQMDRDVHRLEKELRCAGNPDHRIQAAQALASLDRLEHITVLLNSVLRDPDPSVQKAVRGVLQDLLGSDLELALKMEASGGIPGDPWLVECHSNESAVQALEKTSLSGRIESLRKNRNVDGLLDELTCEEYPEHRIQAAQALVEIDRNESLSWLLDAVLYDPDPEVSQSVRDLLKGFLGSDLELALKVEASGGAPDEPWLEKCHEEPEWITDEALESGDFVLEDTHTVTAQEVQEMHGMLAVLRGETNPDLRIRAIHALQHLPDIGVVQALADVALSEPDERVRQAARSVLQKHFGDDLDDLLNTYRSSEDVEEEAVEEAIDLIESPVNTSSVIQEEKQPVWLWILLGIGVVVAAFLLLRGG